MKAERKPPPKLVAPPKARQAAPKSTKPPAARSAPQSSGRAWKPSATKRSAASDGTRAGPSADHLHRARGAQATLKLVEESFNGWGRDEKWKAPKGLEPFVAADTTPGAQLLWRLENPTGEEKARASQLNRGVAECLSKTKRFPFEAALSHVTSAPGAAAVLKSANFDALFLPQAADTPTLGSVDFTRVSGASGKNVSPKDVVKTAEAFGQLALVYDPARLKPTDLREVGGRDMGSYANHWTHSVGVPNTALAALLWVGTEAPSAEVRKSLENALVARGLYVPIVSARGEVLFTPAAFDRARSAT